MSETQLNSFGSILSFAAQQESALADFYRSHESLQDHANRAAKRSSQLTLIRQENVTEMILEPITGLNADDYWLADLLADQGLDIRERVRQGEGRLARMYSECGPKLNITEARRVFQKFAQEAESRLAESTT